nr:hypothetical protein P5621_01255 [Bacillus subtilis]
MERVWYRNFKAGVWMVFYLLTMMVISYLGSDKFGGLNVIHYGWDMVLIAMVSLVFYVWALKSGYQTEYLKDAKEINSQLLNGQSEAAAGKE